MMRKSKSKMTAAGLAPVVGALFFLAGCDESRVSAPDAQTPITIGTVPSAATASLDVEGSEMKVLKGLNETIKKYHPAIMIEINNNYNTDEIFNFLIEKGYDQFLDFSLLNDSNVLSQIKNINLLDQNLSQEKIALDMVFFKSN